MNNIRRSFSLLVPAFMLAFFICSCTTPKKMVYMNDLPDSTGSRILTDPRTDFEARIQKNDQLSIIIGATNSQDMAILNAASGGMAAGMGNMSNVQGGSASGYLVEADGTISLPYLGKYKVEGLKRTELEQKLTEAYKEYTKNPVVSVRFLNYKVTVLGEVGRPGDIAIPGERLTILEAIGLAGDLTVLGHRENVLVIREEGGKREYGRMNLLSKDVFESPYFYLQTRDVVYVEPAKAKFMARERLPQFLSLAATGISLLITIITITNR